MPGERYTRYRGLSTVLAETADRMNATKMLSLACEREQKVVVRWTGEDGQERQTPPVHVRAVAAAEDGVVAALLDEGTRRAVPFSVECSRVTLVHPEPTEPEGA